MSAAEDEVNFRLNVMIKKDQTKVLLAEIDRDLADVLLSFRTMPLGKIVSVLKNHYGDKEPVIGSLNMLHNSLVNLDTSHFWTEVGKQMLANPRSSFEDELRKLKLNVYDAQPTKYFTCGDWDCKKRGNAYITMYHGSKCCLCSKSMNTEIGVKKSDIGATDCGIFTPKTMSFLISDDMQMMPNVPGSMIRILGNMGVTDINEAELKPVTIGLNELIALLKGVLLSKTPLTDVILNVSRAAKSAPVDQMIGVVASSNSKKITVKAMIHKSTNKLLFIQSEEDFVDFLFSLLAIPLGGTVRLLGCRTSCGSVDNFHRSIGNLKGIKHGILDPMLPPKYCSDSQLLTLIEQTTPGLYYYLDYEKRMEFLSHSSINCLPNCKPDYGSRVCFVDPKGGKTYLKRPGVRDEANNFIERGQKLKRGQINS